MVAFFRRREPGLGNSQEKIIELDKAYSSEECSLILELQKHAAAILKICKETKNTYVQSLIGHLIGAIDPYHNGYTHSREILKEILPRDLEVTKQGLILSRDSIHTNTHWQRASEDLKALVAKMILLAEELATKLKQPATGQITHEE